MTSGAGISNRIGRDPGFRYLREVKEVHERTLNKCGDEIHPV